MIYLNHGDICMHLWKGSVFINYYAVSSDFWQLSSGLYYKMAHDMILIEFELPSACQRIVFAFQFAFQKSYFCICIP